jgi:hypothetical protein
MIRNLQGDFMKVTRNHLQIAVLVLGGILILYGVLKLAFRLNFGPFVEQNLPSTVMIAAVAIFGWNRYILSQERKARDEEEAKKKAAETPEIPAEASASIEAPIEPKS